MEPFDQDESHRETSATRTFSAVHLLIQRVRAGKAKDAAERKLIAAAAALGSISTEDTWKAVDLSMISSIFIGLGPGRPAQVMVELLSENPSFPHSPGHVRLLCEALQAIFQAAILYGGHNSAAVNEQMPAVAAAVAAVLHSLQLQWKTTDGGALTGAGLQAKPMKGPKPKILLVEGPRAPWVMEHIPSILKVRALDQRICVHHHFCWQAT